jgi:hypothetical protein
MTIAAGRHHTTNLMRCAARPSEQYGDVELSVQASRFHASDPRNGCGHTPLELYERVEVALRWANARGWAHRWIRQPSRELGIDGFDDLWLSPEDVPVAEYVRHERVTALRAALAERTRSLDGRAVEREAEAAVDRRPPVVELEDDSIDVSAPGDCRGARGGLTWRRSPPDGHGILALEETARREVEPSPGALAEHPGGEYLGGGMARMPDGRISSIVGGRLQRRTAERDPAGRRRDAPGAPRQGQVAGEPDRPRRRSRRAPAGERQRTNLAVLGEDGRRVAQRGAGPSAVWTGQGMARCSSAHSPSASASSAPTTPTPPRPDAPWRRWRGRGAGRRRAADSRSTRRREERPGARPSLSDALFPLSPAVSGPAGLRRQPRW